MIAALGRAVVAGRATWWAPALIAALASCLVGPCLLQVLGALTPSMAAAAVAHGTTPEELLASGTTVSVTLGLSATVVMGVVASAGVGQQTAQLALWRLAGAGPALVGAFVLAQLLVVSAASGGVGLLVTITAGREVTQILNSLTAPGLRDVPAPLVPGALVATALSPVLVMLAAGAQPALRAMRVPPVRAVQRGEEVEAPSRLAAAMHWAGAVAGTGLLAVCLVAALAARPSGMDAAASAALGIGALVILACALGARVLPPRILRAWSRAVPIRSPLWELARSGATDRARTTGAGIVSLAVGTGVLTMFSGVGYTMERTMRAVGLADQAFDYTDVRVMSLAVGIFCAAGGICVMALVAADRRREVALLRACGLPPAGIVRMVLAESVLVAGTSTAIAATATVLALGVLAVGIARLGMPVLVVLPWAELGFCAVLSALLMALCLLLPARRALRASVRTALAPV